MPPLVRLAAIIVALTSAPGWTAAREQIPAGCREPFATAELVRTVVERWDTWTVDELRAFWPDALDSVDVPPAENHLPRDYGHFAQEGACGDVFLFTSAVRGNAQFLDQIELRFVSESLDDVELAGKDFLRSFGKPFQLLSEGYDEWRLDENGWMHREYRWDEPEIRVAIEVQKRASQFLLSVVYDRTTMLDRPAPSRPDEPLELHLSLGDAEIFAPSRSTCVGDDVDAHELRRATELARLVERELTSSEGWFRIVPRDEADYVVLLGAHWEEGEEASSRCVSADVELPGQVMGIAIVEGSPNWRELQTLETGARALARGLAESFQKEYHRLLNQRREDYP